MTTQSLLVIVLAFASGSTLLGTLLGVALGFTLVTKKGGQHGRWNG